MIVMGTKMKLRALLLSTLLCVSSALADVSQEPAQSGQANTSHDLPVNYPPDTPQGASIAIGQNAMLSPAVGNVNGQANTAIGSQAMRGIMTSAAVNDTCIGYQACKLTSGNNVTGIGVIALSSGTSQRVIALGSGAAGSTANDNVYIDPENNASPFAGSFNVSIGDHTPYSQTGGTILGDDCFYSDINSGNGYNICIGENVARTNIGVGGTVPTQTMMIGTGSSLDGVTNAATQVIGIGSGAPGQFDTMIGYNVLTAQTTNASKNTALGNTALHALTSGTHSVAVGYSAGSSITTGTDNTVIGYSVGSSTLTTGSSNILIGTSSAVTTPASSTASMLNIGGLVYGDLAGTSTPTISACGSSPAIDTHANNASGTVTAGSGTVGSCTITFASAYNTWSHCKVTSQAGLLANFAYSYTLAALTITATSITSDKFDYECDGY